MLGAIIASAVAGLAVGAGGTLALVGRHRGGDAEAAADAARAAGEAASGAAEAATAPQVAAEETVQALIARDPAHWLCDGPLADPMGCAWAVCVSVAAASPGGAQAAPSCADLADAYIARAGGAP